MNLFIKQNFTFFSFIIILLLISSCNQTNQNTDKRSVFNYNEMAGVTSLDPAASSNTENIWPVNQIFNGLVEMNDSLKVVPSIAKRWYVSKDGLTYTFTLRNDVYFHDNICFEKEKGRKLTAKDVVYSFNRLYDISGLIFSMVY